jgi:hypothetical protein
MTEFEAGDAGREAVAVEEEVKDGAEAIGGEVEDAGLSPTRFDAINNNNETLDAGSNTAARACGNNTNTGLPLKRNPRITLPTVASTRSPRRYKRSVLFSFGIE